ncbi:unnamed protein product [Linum trigynum]|uniref:BOI-related E3 ubiquitin-protein ligase 3 n=1 Tax=Linum trigynum TaxID=586398 RepID=A0AAV2ERI9_9ROSI
MAIQAQFYGSQEWPVVENGFVPGVAGAGFMNNNSCFLINNLEQQQQKQQQFHNNNLQQQQQQRNGGTNLINNNNGFFVSKIGEEKPAPASTGLQIPSAMTTNSNTVNPSVNSLAAYEQKQRQEIDHYIRVQNERLRLMLQEQRKQQLALLLKTIESKATVLLRQKDEEIARAAKRATELETFLRRLEMENQAWQRAAKENEAMAISLSHTLAQVRENSSLMMMNNNNNNNMNGGFGGGGEVADDAESCCREKGDEEEEGEKEETTSGGYGVVCKSCNSRGACVLFLPCRHLCSCRACDGFLDRCPLCQTPKKASIEALMA